MIKKLNVVPTTIVPMVGGLASAGVVGEFREFIKDYKVVGLAVAVIVGTAATGLISSLVNNIIMPIITFFIPTGEWESATYAIGTISIGWGAFLAALVNFIIIALVVFSIAKWVIREEKQKKK